MAHTHQYLTYYIHLTDLAVVTALQATGSPETIGAVLTNPDAIATERTAPIKLKTQPFVAPCLTSEWFGSPAQFPTNVDTFDRKSGGWFGIPWLFGDTTTYHWRGLWTYAPPAVVPGVSVPINIAKLRWMDGFEILDPAAGNIGPENGLNGDANNDNKYNSHAASRHADGSGFAWRNNTLIRTHNITENGALLSNAYASWERFYLRLWQAPAAQTRLWTSRTTNALDGYALEITPSGQIAYGWQNSAGTFVLVGTAATALPIGVWKKIDVRFWFGSPTLGANQFELWINGVIAASGLINAAGALGGPAGTPPPTWSALTTYIVGQTAYSGGRAYQCIVQHTNQAPPNVTYWTDVSQVAIDGTSLGYFKPHASSRLESRFQGLLVG